MGWKKNEVGEGIQFMGLAAIFTIKLHETSQKLWLLFLPNLLPFLTQLKIPVISLTSSDFCAPH